MRMLARALVGLLVTLGAAMFALGEPMKPAPSNQSDSGKKPSEIVECRVMLDPGSLKRYYVEFCITDPDSIKNLVIDPIEKAVRDPEPAAYVVVGMITVIRKDGAAHRYTLFRPWGYFSHGKDYLISDFTKLRDAFKEALDQPKGILEEVGAGRK